MIFFNIVVYAQHKLPIFAANYFQSATMLAE